MDSLATYGERTFEDIKHINEYGAEYWLARELAQALQYSDWRNFENAIFKAMEACKNSGNEIADHFGDVTTFTNLGRGATCKIGDYALSRYACRLRPVTACRRCLGASVCKRLGAACAYSLPLLQCICKDMVACICSQTSDYF